MRGLSEEYARNVFLGAGLEPLEPFLGAKYKWLCRCRKCNHEYSPYYSSVNAGHGCPNCFKAKQAEAQRRQGLATARETCKKLDYKIVGQYANARTQTEIECLLCGESFNTTLDALQSKTKTCACRKVARKRLSEHRPDLFREIDWDANVGLLPDLVGTGTRKIISWRCDSKGHLFRTSPATRCAGNGECLVCSGFYPEPGVNDFATLHPKLAAQFLEDPREGLSPGEVHAGSSRVFKWQCPLKSDHKYSNSVWARVKGEGCPYCANKKVLRGDNDFASNNPELLREWDFELNTEFEPHEITSGSHKKAHWVCKQGHKWRTAVNKRTQGAGCEKCHWFEPGRNDLGTLGSSLLVTEWDSIANGLEVNEVRASSPTKYLWVCVGCSESFSASPTNRHYNNTGCPDCASTGYSAKKPSTLYFLESEKLLARKIGKTNTQATHDRIGKFEVRGWSVIQRWDLPTGHLVDAVEKAALGWVREELELPQYLSKDDMRGMAGETETFSIEGPENATIQIKIEELFQLLSENI